MGNSNGAQKLEDSSDDVAYNSKVYDIKRIYWDNEGNLRYGRSKRNRDEEVIQMLQNDSAQDDDIEKLWIIIPSRWIRKWLIFAHMKLGPDPGIIDTDSLLVKDSASYNGWRPLKTLKPPFTSPDITLEETPGHFRRISRECWDLLVDFYEVQGPTIAVRGIPYEDLGRWRCFPTAADIDIDVMPLPDLPSVEEPKEEEAGVASAVTNALGSIGAMFG